MHDETICITCTLTIKNIQYMYCGVLIYIAWLVTFTNNIIIRYLGWNCLPRYSLKLGLQSHILDIVALTLIGLSSPWPVTTGEICAAWKLVYSHIQSIITLTLCCSCVYALL